MNTSKKITIQQRIGEQIRLARQMKKMSQSELAELCNLSQQTISDFERGRAEPSLTNAIKLCEALGLMEPDQPKLIDLVTIGTRLISPR